MVSDVTSTDGVPLRVHQSGAAGTPTVVCVHGYPDDHTVWDGVVAELASRYHLVCYDLRGAGESGKPRDRQAYRLDQLARDLAVVVEAASPDRPVHLLAHDWGATQTWHALTGQWLRGRVASFTSISGPGLDHAGHWLRARLRRPTPRALRELTTQLVSSWYIGFFQLPLLPELAWRAGLPQRALALAGRAGTPAVTDGVNGLRLYRANMLPRQARPRPQTIDVPVQVLAPHRDPFVSRSLQTDVGRWVPDLAVRELPGGHWLPHSHPHTVARCVSELVDHAEGGRESRTLRRARRTGPHRRRFEDTLVVITGAGSGIGRATALEFAERGAEVVVTDIEARAAERTARLAGTLGPPASAYTVDVSDGGAVEKFGAVLLDEHGIPDIVVNNAGIGMAGPFFDTTVADWERVIDVNLWGVIHGCRVLGGLQVAGGAGGTIVNIASAVAYLPTRALPAYATTKAAVLALSQCLRGELADAGIGVVAICPGFVHTDIVSTTRFVGLDATEEHATRRRATEMYRRRNFTPERAAREILRAVERNAAIAPITVEAKVGLLASRLTPGLLRALARAEWTTFSGR
ncbi:MAG: SDR family oxidoreductase [Pseudonocardiales bacterium]|nr:SDR family oxidoreductase [Pseudonocardiales bacterium]MBV9029213.1 SDR family oxidoreductase [Pseudonocardiales bacterium]MBW0009700.1 SDR family oxidoreductase [Pseudonocardiales bacterium]